MYKVLQERHILNNLKQKRVKKHPVFKQPFNKWSYLYDSFKLVEYRALVLLKLIYPNGINNYLLKPNMFQFSLYEPNLELYIDYFEFLSHSGPYNQYRSFDPQNKEDVAFIEEVKHFNAWDRKRWWVSIDRANTWAGVDFDKLMYMKYNKKKYKIFWSINQIEQQATKEMIDASWLLIKSYQDSLILQDIIFNYNKRQ